LSSFFGDVDTGLVSGAGVPSALIAGAGTGVAVPEADPPFPKRLAKAPVAESCERRLRSIPPAGGACGGGGEAAAWNAGIAGGAGERAGGGGTIAVGRIGGGEDETGRGFKAAS